MNEALKTFIQVVCVPAYIVVSHSETFTNFLIIKLLEEFSGRISIDII